MTMDITKSVAFTGHRSERIFQVRMLYLYLDIVSQVKRLYTTIIYRFQFKNNILFTLLVRT